VAAAGQVLQAVQAVLAKAATPLGDGVGVAAPVSRDRCVGGGGSVGTAEDEAAAEGQALRRGRGACPAMEVVELVGSRTMRGACRARSGAPEVAGGGPRPHPQSIVPASLRPRRSSVHRRSRETVPLAKPRTRKKSFPGAPDSRSASICIIVSLWTLATKAALVWGTHPCRSAAGPGSGTVAARRHGPAVRPPAPCVCCGLSALRTEPSFEES
jgi:hypothetical protein